MLKNPRVHLGAVLWLLAMCGVAVMLVTVLPQLVAKAPGKVSLGVAMTANAIQSAVMVLLAVWAGVSLSRPLGLGAPVIEAALSGSAPWPALKRQLLPAALVGFVTGAFLLLMGRWGPVALIAAGQTEKINLAAKVLYGGVTEEVLLRWGLLTLLIWLPWRLLHKKAGRPRLAWVIAAIVVAGIVFGVGHLPFAAGLGIKLTAPIVAVLIIGNALPGILFGFLYWRRGIEAAMMAHAMAHVVAVVFSAA